MSQARFAELLSQWGIGVMVSLLRWRHFLNSNLKNRGIRHRYGGGTPTIKRWVWSGDGNALRLVRCHLYHVVKEFSFGFRVIISHRQDALSNAEAMLF